MANQTDQFDRNFHLYGTNVLRSEPFHRLLSLVIAAACAIILQALATNDAEAQSRVCISLQNQLARASTGGGPVSPQYAKFDRAVRDQRSQIAKTERISTRTGCRGLFSRSNRCTRIRDSLQKMRANLSKLEQQRARHAPKSSGPSRNAILRQMQQNGCTASGVVEAREDTRPRRRTLVEQIFGVRRYRNDGRADGGEAGDEDFINRFNTYRTLCVRKCDGYYFPISFSTVRERFEGDSATCSEMCPGTDVELFYHSVAGQDSEDMISYRTDQPYTALPTAFNYRKQFNAECRCGRVAARGFTEVAGSTGETVTPGEDEVVFRIGIPKWREDRALDPETQTNETGALTMADLRGFSGSKDEGQAIAEHTSDRKIRIVGPAFFPDQ